MRGEDGDPGDKEAHALPKHRERCNDGLLRGKVEYDADFEGVDASIGCAPAQCTTDQGYVC